MQEKKKVKIVVLGTAGMHLITLNPGVGKTSLMLRYVNGTFDDTQSNVGVDFLSKTIQHKGTEFTLQIYDTAGQERYAPIARQYYKSAQVAILVYDITSTSSFEFIDKWMRELKNEGPKDIVYAILGNKIDLIDQQTVDFGEAMQYAKDNNAIFAHTSALLDKGIGEIFTKIAEQLLGKPPPMQEPENPDMMMSQSYKLEPKKKDFKQNKKEKEGCNC